MGPKVPSREGGEQDNGPNHGLTGVVSSPGPGGIAGGTPRAAVRRNSREWSRGDSPSQQTALKAWVAPCLCPTKQEFWLFWAGQLVQGVGQCSQAQSQPRQTVLLWQGSSLATWPRQASIWTPHALRLASRSGQLGPNGSPLWARACFLPSLPPALLTPTLPQMTPSALSPTGGGMSGL